MLWWSDMKKILLFSDYKVIYEITYKIIEEDYKLEWRTYDLVEGNQHFVPDAVIMYLDSKMLETGVFELIIKVKRKYVNMIPILVLIENGTKQDIFSVLKAGAYDYLEKEDLQQYRKKIEEMILWGWYLKKYSVKKLQ